MVTGIACVHTPHPLGFGLLAAAAVQIACLAVAYVLEYLDERVGRRAMQTAIGQELKTVFVPNATLPRKMVVLLKALHQLPVEA
jgi:hypothetical protein